MLNFPYNILFWISHYFHYCAPVDSYYACNYSHFSHKHAPEIFHTCKLVTVYAHQRVLMVVVPLPLLSRVLQLSPLQVQKFTTTRAVNSFPYYSMGTSLPSIFQHYSRIILAPRYYYARNYARIWTQAYFRYVWVSPAKRPSWSILVPRLSCTLMTVWDQ